MNRPRRVRCQVFQCNAPCLLPIDPRLGPHCHDHRDEAQARADAREAPPRPGTLRHTVRTGADTAGERWTTHVTLPAPPWQEKGAPAWD